MKVEEVYSRFHIALNKNNEDDNINVDKGNFVLLFNREAENVLMKYIELNNNSDNIFVPKEFIVNERELEMENSTPNFVEYVLPEDYFQIIPSSPRSIVNNSCNTVIYNSIVKPGDVSAYLRDNFLKPKLEWERGIATISENKLKVFVDGYSLKTTYLSYFKKPNYIDIEGYIDFDGSSSKNIDPEYSDYFVNKVIDSLVLEVQRQYENQVGVNVSSQRISPI